MDIEVVYNTLTIDRDHTPFMVLKELNGSRTLRIAVSGYDANRLAITGLKLLKIETHELSNAVIKALGATIERIDMKFQSKKMVVCYIVLHHGKQTTSIEARPGEAIALAIANDTPIFAEEKLFFSQKDTISLKERLRAMSTLDFGHALLH